jgi:hypothetical protein
MLTQTCKPTHPWVGWVGELTPAAILVSCACTYPKKHLTEHDHRAKKPTCKSTPTSSSRKPLCLCGFTLLLFSPTLSLCHAGVGAHLDASALRAGSTCSCAVVKSDLQLLRTLLARAHTRIHAHTHMHTHTLRAGSTCNCTVVK